MNEINVKDQSAVRREKLKQLRQNGNAYPNGDKPNTTISALFERYNELDKTALEAQNTTYHLAGRIMQYRQMGKAAFIHIQDYTGRLQIYLRKQDLPEEEFDQSKTWDLGDIIFVTGHIFKTQKGELSIYSNHVKLLTKSLHPLPDKYHGLTDKEACYRMRYLDLMVNKDTQKRFKVRSKIIQSIRQTLIDADFLEVETPMMHTLAGGATAKPFLTHHNALDIPLYLRIAPELFLKRLVVGGFEKVFEINRNFRNEGISTRHNPEFTMLEFYQAHATYEDLIQLTEQMLEKISMDVSGSTQITYADYELNFKGPYIRMRMSEAVAKFTNHEEHSLHSIDTLKQIAQANQLSIDSDDWGVCLLELFESIVEKKLIQPTFITHYPRSVSPLARVSDDNPELTDRFEFFVAGQEIANGFSELNDPDDQRSRFEMQMKALEAGDDEAMPYDDDYINALEYGLPPTAGEGIGIDRLTMLMTNSTTIRDVILFPTLKRVT
tara:strand:- start:3146 stop:4627 length:1482 start_codon:yes stop_codon:yes gene_type:complete